MAPTVLRPPQPFDLRLSLRAAGIGSFDATGAAWYVTTTTHGAATARLESAGEDVRAELWGSGADALLAALPRVLGFDDTAASPPKGGGLIADLARRSRGLRLGSTGNVHEVIVPTILGQLVTTREARAGHRRMMRALGDRAPGEHPGLFVPPTPDRLASLGYEDLHTYGIERKRAQVVIEASRRASRLEEIIAMEPEVARRRLLAVRGVGPWTAETVMGVAYGDRNAVPPGDHNLPHMVAWALAGEDRASDDRMFELLEPYRPERRRAVVLIKQSGIHAPRYGPKTPVRRHL